MKSRTLYINEKTTAEDTKMEFVTSKYQLHQIINESIHVIETPLFCTDLIFTSQQNFGSTFKCSSIFTPKLPSSNIINRKYGVTSKRTPNLLEH